MAAYPVDILNLRQSHFVFWLPGVSPPSPPQLLVGTYESGGGAFVQLALQAFAPADGRPGLWLLDPASVVPALPDGAVLHYWFRLGAATVTDPFAFAVDYGHSPAAARAETLQPPAVVRLRDGALWPCDVDGAEPRRPAVPPPDALPANNHLVLYELPTSWARGGTGTGTGTEIDVGTFADVRALLDPAAAGRNFAAVPAVQAGAVLQELGINALELLPPADAKARGAWGYATAHYFAPDYDLGTASELVALAETLHARGCRLFVDVVMAFGHDPYAYADDAAVFHIDPDAEPGNPDSYQSHAAAGQKRDAFGGRLWRYLQSTPATYDPETGQTATVHPSWAFHKAHLARWMADFGVDGLRLDSINNVGNWDFVRAYKQRAWDLYRARYDAAAGAAAADPARFLVVGEELSLPAAMLQQGCLDALWNENWLQRLRAALLGESWGGDDDFAATVRKLVDCRQDVLDGGRFADGAQAVIYVTSHDIEGYRKNRLYDFFHDYGVWDVARRAKLAFALLLTSVGVPMIFAGEEFADQQDQSLDPRRKQADPVNYERRDDGGWRQALFAYVAALVRFRIACPALGLDDTDVFHVDASRGGKILAWRRGGGSSGAAPVVVVANFTDDDTPGTTYEVPNWPDQATAGWREVTQNRDVPAEWVGREPLFAWEAKVYTYWRA